MGKIHPSGLAGDQQLPFEEDEMPGPREVEVIGDNPGPWPVRAMAIHDRPGFKKRGEIFPEIF